MKTKKVVQTQKNVWLILLITICSYTSGVAQANPKRADIVQAFKEYPKSKHKEFVAKVFDCDENKKLHEFTLLLTPKGYIQFGSNPKIVGRDNIEQMLIAFNKNFKHLGQHIIKVYKDSETEIVYSAEATYSFEDGTSLQPIPYMVHLTFSGNEVSDYIIYIDLAPFNQKVSSK